jgi:hypothetical protein
MARVGEAEAVLALRDHQTAGTRSVRGRTVRPCSRGIMYRYACRIDRP